jgi:hypothetical protein
MSKASQRAGPSSLVLDVWRTKLQRLRCSLPLTTSGSRSGRNRQRFKPLQTPVGHLSSYSSSSTKGVRLGIGTRAPPLVCFVYGTLLGLQMFRHARGSCCRVLSPRQLPPAKTQLVPSLFLPQIFCADRYSTLYVFIVATFAFD